MFTETYDVRFYETDALKHVSNTALAGWFESGRTPIFKIFNPELDLDNWPLILASYKIDFLQQIYLAHPVTVKTWICRLGKSSFDVYQELHQEGQIKSTGVTTMVHFDYKTQKSAPISDEIREILMAHFRELPN